MEEIKYNLLRRPKSEETRLRLKIDRTKKDYELESYLFLEFDPDTIKDKDYEYTLHHMIIFYHKEGISIRRIEAFSHGRRRVETIMDEVTAVSPWVSDLDILLSINPKNMFLEVGTQYINKTTRDKSEMYNLLSLDKNREVNGITYQIAYKNRTNSLQHIVGGEGDNETPLTDLEFDYTMRILKLCGVDNIYLKRIVKCLSISDKQFSHIVIENIFADIKSFIDICILGSTDLSEIYVGELENLSTNEKMNVGISLIVYLIEKRLSCRRNCEESTKMITTENEMDKKYLAQLENLICRSIYTDYHMDTTLFSIDKNIKVDLTIARNDLKFKSRNVTIYTNIRRYTFCVDIDGIGTTTVYDALLEYITPESDKVLDIGIITIIKHIEEFYHTSVKFSPENDFLKNLKSRVDKHFCEIGLSPKDSWKKFEENVTIQTDLYPEFQDMMTKRDIPTPMITEKE